MNEHLRQSSIKFNYSINTFIVAYICAHNLDKDYSILLALKIYLNRKWSSSFSLLWSFESPDQLFVINIYILLLYYWNQVKHFAIITIQMMPSLLHGVVVESVSQIFSCKDSSQSINCSLDTSLSWDFSGKC